MALRDTPAVAGPEPLYYNAPIPEAMDLGWSYSEAKNQLQMAKVSQKDRATHLYVIGATGTGKTKFLEFLIAQDIDKGHGFGVIDPHGDLVEDVKGILACRYRRSQDEREISERTVLIDPTDSEFTAIFNPLEPLPNTSAAEQANELISCFRRIWADSWGVRMEDLLRNALIALGEAGRTLPELPSFLTTKTVRRDVLYNVGHPIARAYFERFDGLAPSTQATWIQPVMNKVNAFLADDRIREMLSAPHSTVNLRQVMDQGMILLIKLDKGRLKGAGDLLGSLLMAKLQMAAFSRSDLPENERRPFYLYVDEFQNYANASFQVVLSEARKYGLSLTMAHQTLAQVSSELRSLILGNAGIQVYFRLNRQDAQLLAKEAFEYSGFEVKRVRSHSPVFWSFAEEWERKIEELQNLAPRVCVAKHKIEGGVLLLYTADMDPAWQTLRMSPNEYWRYLRRLPFGRKHLVARSAIPAPVLDIPLSDRPAARGEEAAPTMQVAERAPTPPEPSPARELNATPRAEVATPEPAERKAGRRHKYLQGLIKRAGEESGFRAIIEKSTPDGLGKVDVSLEREGLRIACEVSVTTSAQQELANLRKCLAAGYDQVVSCCADKRKLRRLRDAVEKGLEEPDRGRVFFFEPDELVVHLMRLGQEGQTVEAPEQRVKGYKVKVRRRTVSGVDEEEKKAAIAQVLVEIVEKLLGLLVPRAGHLLQAALDDLIRDRRQALDLAADLGRRLLRDAALELLRGRASEGRPTRQKVEEHRAGGVAV